MQFRGHFIQRGGTESAVLILIHAIPNRATPLCRWAGLAVKPQELSARENCQVSAALEHNEREGG